MSRIVYIAPRPGSNTGGNKILFRHVEALLSLGYHAVVRSPAPFAPPTWFHHTAAMEDTSRPIEDSDILVIAEDAEVVLSRCALLPNPKVIFCQNPHAMAGNGFASLPDDLRANYRTFIACNTGVAGFIARYFDYGTISVVPAFADERTFMPAPKVPVIVCAPRKRPAEYRAIRYMFERLYSGPTPWVWEVLETATEVETAAAMGRASLFLSLARLEALSLTILEAMASHCLIAGFTGIGPREYTSPVNGFWVDEDDCEAAAVALVQAATLADRGGGAAALMRHSAGATAARWTHAGFVGTLNSFWRDQMGVTP
jgi:hypothetical protein